MPRFDHFAIVAPLYARVTYSRKNIMSGVAELPVKGRLLALFMRVGGGTGRVSSAIRGLVDEVVIADVSFEMLKKAPPISLGPVCGIFEHFSGFGPLRVLLPSRIHAWLSSLSRHAHTQVPTGRYRDANR